MKIELIKIKHKWKKGGFHTNPNLGWGLILGVSLAIALWALAFGTLLFREVQREYVPEEAGQTQIRIVKKARLEKVLEYFSTREKFSQDMLSDPSPIIDPSI